MPIAYRIKIQSVSIWDEDLSIATSTLSNWIASSEIVVSDIVYEFHKNKHLYVVYYTKRR